MDPKAALNGGGDDVVSTIPERLHCLLDQFAETQHLGA